MKADVLMPSTSLYGVLGHFTEKIYEALVRAGVQCRLLTDNDRFLVPLNSPPDFTIGFNGALYANEKILLPDFIKVPHVSCLVDPFFRFLELVSSQHLFITCDDREGCALLNELNFSQTFFMPQAVELELAASCEEKEKIYDIVLLATSIDCEKRRAAWRTHFPPQIYKGMDLAAEITLSDDTTSFIKALQETLHLNLTTSLLSSSQYQKAFMELELYIKGKDRLELLKALSDCHIHLFGDSIEKKRWRDLLNNPHIKFHDPIPYEEAIDVMQKSKIVLNSCIKNKLGAHERIFTALACNAVPVTNENAFLKQEFAHGQQILYYSRKGISKIQEEVQGLLKDEDRRRAIAQSGKSLVLKRHTWDSRIASLLPEILTFIERVRSSN